MLVCLFKIENALLIYIVKMQCVINKFAIKVKLIKSKQFNFVLIFALSTGTPFPGLNVAISNFEYTLCVFCS
jgi:hypothetical protein